MILYGSHNSKNNYKIKRKTRNSEKNKKKVDWVNIVLVVTLLLVVFFFFFR